ncbi:DUF4595 domain-containing protein [Spirosoma sp. BT702]|uniref:DUF4595 domain-containing protein n=1 Tax=Spirosoma profusum TaxID=2771354 RepID=A0A926Y1M3_9BACT|nr:DUF4595 domain-containing protein [Spirosoma profusum]MBD2704335.1 DUF4595 domain-containing protein [Spirosoma profusum]
MNTFVKSTLALFGVALTMSLVSCNKDSMMESVRPDNGVNDNNTRPDGPGTISPINSGDVIVAQFKKYTLVKQGSSLLSYDVDGNINKLGSSFEPNYYWEFIRASNGSGMTIQLLNNFKLWNKTLVLFDAQKRAKTSFVNKYDNSGNHLSQVQYDYQYNGAGKLQSIVGNNNEQYVFSYDGSGNLEKIDISRSGKKQVMQFQFQGATDKIHLNPIWQTMYDQIPQYLPIFGKFSNKLLTSFKLIDLPSNNVLEDVTYSYTLNADGMPTNKHELRKTGGYTLNYDYSMEYNVTFIKP